jgi:methyltransferase-like protein/cyclopropane fatty-acyl-phospholipid synthase-like methyltransferase
MASPKLESPTLINTRPTANSYDEVPYDSHPYPQTHPSRLATIAKLFGLSTPRVDKCRVLELGCASGGNLIPMAEALPESWFVGLDLSARQIGDGETMVKKLGLTNISLRHASILDVNESFGSFDYVICHGVFSWVPDSIQHKILDICVKNLSSDGVAYVSYNTYPGWHIRGMIRDMMRYHAQRFDTPNIRVKQARALLDFLTQSARQDGGAYATLLRAELEALRHQADHYLYHEHLEDENSPLYFHEFAALLDQHGLRYLGEARITTMVAGNFTRDVQNALETVAADQIQAEQYLDFVRNRTFRESLLVRSDAVHDWAIQPDAIRDLHIGTSHKVVDKPGDVRSNEVVQYKSKSGITLSASSPPLKAAMRVLAERWPGTIPFEELSQTINAMIDPGHDIIETLALGLLNTYLSTDLLELHSMPIPAINAGEKPVALPSVRARLAAGEPGAANRRHEHFQPGEFDRKVIPLLDGTRNRSELLSALVELALKGELTVQASGQTLTDSTLIGKALEPVLEKALLGYSHSSLLIG